MKVFISHSHQDNKYTDLISDALKKAGHEVWVDSLNLKLGDNFISKINDALKESDAFIIIVSENSIRSEYVSKEISTIALREISDKKTRIIPVLIDKSTVPQYLAQYLYVDLSQDLDSGLGRIIQALSDKPETISLGDKKEKRNYDKTILELSKALKDGKLTLISGAGSSVGAGIPLWNDLLIRLLESMMKKISNDHSVSLKKANPNDFQKKYGPSSLVVGKYLKSNLGNDFLKELRNALYVNNPKTCDVIEAIIDLARPQRDGKPLDSIITFNFDSLIEENLDKNNVKYKAIYMEGMRNTSLELPIYHVHGYLPREGIITKNNEIVFSEESYHSQFIDPFSWSNLIQLNKLSQNTCLFLGLSVADPNLRRLLDVANRKNPSKSLNHYIIKDIPNMGNPNDTIDNLAMFLTEQDYNELGLNVIWVNDFKEIPKILKQIANE